MGYGDYAPTYWATQMMLVALLVLTFTLLPYMTSNLMDALTSTSSFERKRWVQGVMSVDGVLGQPSFAQLCTLPAKHKHFMQVMRF